MATTSTKPAHVIKADVKRVLDRMQVQHREIRGGFECIHVPSIDLASIVSAENGDKEDLPRRSVVRKGSRLSFGKKGDPRAVEKTEEKDKVKAEGKDKAEEKDVPTSRSSLSFAGGLKGQPEPGRTTPTPAPRAETPTGAGTGTATPTPASPQRTKFLPPIPRDFGTGGEKSAGVGGERATGTEKGTNVASDIAEDIFENGTANEFCVRFEISIVKVRPTVFSTFTLREC